MINTTTKVAQNASEEVKQVKSTIEIGIYTVYDCVLKQFTPPVSIPKQKVNDYYTMLVNDVQSPYYNHESDYILNEIGLFNNETGEIELHFIERICILDTFIDQKRRNLQTLLQTLNFLPTGYFKMSEEQKKVIQENIDKATQKYVENYVVPDLDISSEKIKDLEATIADYEERLNIVKD